MTEFTATIARLNAEVADLRRQLEEAQGELVAQRFHADALREAGLLIEQRAEKAEADLVETREVQRRYAGQLHETFAQRDAAREQVRLLAEALTEVERRLSRPGLPHQYDRRGTHVGLCKACALLAFVRESKPAYAAYLKASGEA